MKLILFDSCTPQHQVALCLNGTVIDSATQTRGSLPAMAELLLERKRWSAADLDAVAVTVGPGSYTGIRVGAASAQGLAMAHRLPILELCSLRSMSPEEAGPFAVILDARREHVYCQLGELDEGNLRWLGDPKYCARSSLPKGLPLLDAQPSLELLAHQAHQAYQNGQATSRASLKLLYLRKTQAELEREPLHA